jgi:tRNA A-37 threonylcarbamoyl transferase component Bud32
MDKINGNHLTNEDNLNKVLLNLQKIHNKNIIHYDIHNRNIIINQTNIYFIDFNDSCINNKENEIEGIVKDLYDLLYNYICGRSKSNPRNFKKFLQNSKNIIEKYLNKVEQIYNLEIHEQLFKKVEFNLDDSNL